MKDPNSVSDLIQRVELSNLPNVWHERSSLAITDPTDARVFSLVEKAMDGQSITAMKRTNATQTVVFISLKIEQAAAAYCGAPNTDRATIDECVRFVFAQYGSLNPDEITEAFRMAASGKTDASLEAYHGQFTVKILGSVLSDYMDYRSALAREARSRQAAREAQEEYQRRQEKMLEEHGTAADQIARMSRDRYKAWQDVPGWLARIAVKDGLINLSIDEKAEAWKTAKAYVVNRIPAMIMEADRQEREKWLKAADSVKADPDIFPEVLKEEASTVYAQMLLHNKI